MHATISIFCMFIRVHVHSLTSIGFFYKKLTAKCKENQGWNVLQIRKYDVTYADFKIL